jgi:CDP-diacylglycerol--serine O-phosphatidyltransferase
LSLISPSPKRLIIPTLFTLGNAACGFAGVLWLTSPDAPLGVVPWLLLAGWFFDMFDGTIAKALDATSDFGGQMDSLCDAVTFGVLPALLIAITGGRTPLAVVAALLFLSAVLVRLARFNTESADDPDAKLYFKGLPSTGGALTIGAWAIAHAAVHAHPQWLQLLPGGPGLWPNPLPFVAIVLAAMMVGTRRYVDPTKQYIRGLKPWWHLVPVLVATALVPWPLGLVLLSATYLVAGACSAPARPSAPAEVSA